MRNRKLPLQELSIKELYNSSDLCTYQVPIYQRNFAWGKDEIQALVQDVWDAFNTRKNTYYIGTLVSFHKGEHVYEVIDGQQRLTTIYLALNALQVPVSNKLTYHARKKSDATIASIPSFDTDEKDYGIINGYRFADAAISEIVPSDQTQEFKDYFQNNVHIIHYKVPKDIDLNHYFEIMNSRGEQLEKHEIIKARLIEKLDDSDKEKFNRLWENCSEMGAYIQQKYHEPKIFGNTHCHFIIRSFDELPEEKSSNNAYKIKDFLSQTFDVQIERKEEKLDSFQPIIDFSNFLLIVLKLTRMIEWDFSPSSFILDDKELINEFDKVPNVDRSFVKQFGFNLLKAKYFLDNYLVHHSEEDDTITNNPWKLEYWQKEGKNRYLKNLDGESDYQFKLVQLLSMFEVSFTAKQRKNYLFYCLLYLFNCDEIEISKYHEFVSKLAAKYLHDVYLVSNNLNSINTPNPGSFDNAILPSNELNTYITNSNIDFIRIYGDGSEVSKGIPLFIFNFMDYKLWEKYFDEIRGNKLSETRRDRIDFFESLGCTDFGLSQFENFYFSRTRRSLEHYYPTANANGKDGRPTIDQINCFGNYAMIGSAINSAGSNWSPKTKLEHYLDTASGKIKLVSVASLKFMIMMQKCRDNFNEHQKAEKSWLYEDIKAHQEKMQVILIAK